MTLAAQHYAVAERTLHTGVDNKSALSWQKRGSITTDSTAAYLLRIQALHQRAHRYIPRHSYIPGPKQQIG